jgi:hypothetical protein
MKTGKLMVWYVATMIALLVLGTGVAAARATRTDVEAIDYGCTLVDPGLFFVDEEGIVHYRGQVWPATRGWTMPI